MTARDSNYFERRAAEERAAAERASDPRARQSHIDLADRYESMASGGGSRELRLPAQSSAILPSELSIIP